MTAFQSAATGPCGQEEGGTKWIWVLILFLILIISAGILCPERLEYHSTSCMVINFGIFFCFCWDTRKANTNK